MMNNIRTPVIILSLLILTLFTSSQSFASSHENIFKDDQRKAIEEIVRDYILKNPEAIIRSIQNMEAKTEQDKEQRVKNFIANNQRDLLNDGASFVGGNPKGDITLVEFFDYQCGFCKRVHPTVQKLIKDDGQIRFVYKEFPILGPNSIYAARAAIASKEQGKYLEFHNALMILRGSASKERVLNTARKVGLDVRQLEADIKRQDKEATGILDLNYKLAEKLEVNGTPAFVVGDFVVRGAADYTSLKHVIAQARSKKKSGG